MTPGEWVLVLVGAAVVGQLADLLTTHYFVSREGIRAEGNPLVRQVHEAAGMPGIYALKLGVTAYLVNEALLQQNEFERERQLVSCAWMGLAPAINNLDIIIRG